MQKPIAEIFTWPSESPQLIGTKCDDCGAVTFPAQTRCARCSSQKMTELLLPTRGTVIAWTTQGFPPKPGFQGDPTGKSFQPFGVGLVQLGDVVPSRLGSPRTIRRSSRSARRSNCASCRSSPTRTATRS